MFTSRVYGNGGYHSYELKDPENGILKKSLYQRNNNIEEVEEFSDNDSISSDDSDITAPKIIGYIQEKGNTYTLLTDFDNKKEQRKLNSFLRKQVLKQCLFLDKGNSPNQQNPAIGSIIAKWIIDTNRKRKSNKSRKKKKFIEALANKKNLKRGSSFSGIHRKLRSGIIKGRHRKIFKTLTM